MYRYIHNCAPIQRGNDNGTIKRQWTKSGMPGCFLDKMGHIMCFYVLKGLEHNRLLLLILLVSSRSDWTNRGHGGQTGCMVDKIGHFSSLVDMTGAHPDVL